MLHVLQRHPLRIRAHFEFSLVLAYAFPAEALAPLLPPGLELDTYEGLGLLAIAMVPTRRRRPAVVPRLLGADLVLSGYPGFVRHRDPRWESRRMEWTPPAESYWG